MAGRVDEMSMHGGCPVLEGTKWAANLWVWNGRRYGYGYGRSLVAPTRPEEVFQGNGR
jgi:hypothetical protein